MSVINLLPVAFLGGVRCGDGCPRGCGQCVIDPCDAGWRRGLVCETWCPLAYFGGTFAANDHVSPIQLLDLPRCADKALRAVESVEPATVTVGRLSRSSRGVRNDATRPHSRQSVNAASADAATSSSPSGRSYRPIRTVSSTRERTAANNSSGALDAALTSITWN